MPITPAFAQQFAAEWIAAWNSHDLPRILSHYAADFEMASPVIIKIAGVASGQLRGHAAVGAYWQQALAAIPNLHFQLLDVLPGVNSVVLYYRGHRGTAAEWFCFNAEGLVQSASAHYTLTP